MKAIDAKLIMRKFSVKQRIVFMVVCISIFPIILISVFSYSRAYATVQSTAEAFSTQLINVIAHQLSEAALPEEVLSSSAIQALDSGSKLPDKLFRPGVQPQVQSCWLSRYGKTVQILQGEPLPGLDPGQRWTILPENQGIVMSLPCKDGCSYLHAVFSPTLFTSLLQDDIGPSYNELILLDADGNLLMRAGHTLSVLEKAAVSRLIDAPSAETPTFLEKDHGVFVGYLQLPELEWKLVLTAPYTEMMTSMQSIFFAALLCTTLLLNFAVMVIDSITHPIDALVSSFSDVARTSFEPEVVLRDESQDELGILSAAFNAICAEMRETLREVQRKQEDKHKAEIKMLQAQINPHFLFNTLDSLRFTAMMNNTPIVSDGLAALSHLLRSSILKDNSMVPLEEELQTVEDYLLLQKIRSCEIIRFHREIGSPEVLRCSIMKLLLQPMVENSVIHGIRENQPLDITIRARIDGTTVLIDIIDNGCGFDIEQIGRNSNGLPKSSNLSGIGLANVRDRLQLAYHEDQRFTINSTPGVGTVIHIEMPYNVWEAPEDV